MQEELSGLLCVSSGGHAQNLWAAVSSEELSTAFHHTCCEPTAERPCVRCMPCFYEPLEE